MTTTVSPFDELDDLTARLAMSDLTLYEAVAMVTVLRPVWERVQAENNPPVALELVRSGRRR